MNDNLPRGLRGGARAVLLCVAAATLLTACAEAQLGAQAVKNVVRSDAPEPAPTPVSADPTLAPEVFEATGLTIWDGAATLQGVWLAHPLAARAQRVRVQNLDNNLVIEGAMFKRDPAISGPSILVSSDAARALGLTPGEATELRIVALREGPAPSVVAANPEPAPEVETAALEAPEPAPEASGASGPAATEAAPPEAPAEELEVAEADAETAPAETAAADPAPAAEAEPPVAAEPTPEPAPQPAPESEIALADTQTSPAPQSRPERQADAAPPAVPALGDIRPATALRSGTYLQIGSFGVEPNAQILVRNLMLDGQNAAYVKRIIGGNEYSIVVIGPLSGQAAAEAARAAAAKRGLKDSIEVTL